MRMSDGTSDVCSSDLMKASLPARQSGSAAGGQLVLPIFRRLWPAGAPGSIPAGIRAKARPRPGGRGLGWSILQIRQPAWPVTPAWPFTGVAGGGARKPSALAGLVARILLVDHVNAALAAHRSEEHTSELQSIMRISYAVFCLTNKKKKK